MFTCDVNSVFCVVWKEQAVQLCNINSSGILVKWAVQYVENLTYHFASLWQRKQKRHDKNN